MLNAYSYQYDDWGNRSQLYYSGPADAYTVNYTYDRNNRLLTTARSGSSGTENTRYGCDANGNTLSVAMASNLGGVPLDQTLTYGYDGFNRQISAQKPGVSATYAYGPDGLRRSRTVNGVATAYTYDGGQIVQERGGANARYVRGLNLIASLGGASSYYLYNAHGDVVQRTDGAGNVAASYDYDAFGVARGEISGDTNPFRYCGEYWDGETGSYYLRARNYNPATGRFLAEDPALDGQNWYVYCGNDPTNRIDPLGLADVMLRYIAEKNGAKIDIIQKSFWGIKYGLSHVNVTIGDITTSYTGKIENDRMIIDSAQFGIDFGITDETLLTHQPGDKFATIDDAAIAWGLSYN